MEKTKGRILCVDDDKDTCELVTVLLGQAGYEVIQALNIADGLTLARREHFDLILLDWFFDDGTGLELCQMIRAFDSQTIILFYSGVAYKRRDKEGDQCWRAGLFNQAPRDRGLSGDCIALC